MIATLKITWSELRALFTSPIAWAVLIVFFLHVATVFLLQMDDLAFRQFISGDGSQGRALTRTLFTTQTRGVFDALLPYLALYVPLMTMGVFSRDLRTGGIYLLLSSPVPLSAVVAGKYLAVVAYFSLFAFILTGFILCSGIAIENLDYGHALIGAVAIYLLICSYAAIGVWISSLTSNPVVAAIATLAALGVLGLLGQVGQDWPIVGEVAHWLALSGRTDIMVSGLVTSKDVLYYVLIISLFNGLTYLQLNAGRRPEPKVFFALRIGAFSVSVFVLGLVSSIPGLVLYADVTREKIATLTEKSTGIIREASGPIDVIGYINILDENARQYTARNRRTLIRALFEQYQRFNPQIRVQYELYYGPPANAQLLESNPDASLEDLARQWARDNGVLFSRVRSYEALNATIDLASEDYRPVYVVTWNGRSDVVRTFPSPDPVHHPTEHSLSHGFYRLTAGAGVLAAYAGSNSRSTFDIGAENLRSAFTDKTARRSLVNRGFDLVEFTEAEDLPSGTDLLLLAAPTEPIDSKRLHDIYDYLERGGNAIILADLGTNNALESILSAYGLRQVSAELRQGIEGVQDITVFAEATPEGVDLGLFSSDALNSPDGAMTFETTSGFEIIDAPIDLENRVTPILTADAWTTEDDRSVSSFVLGVAIERKLESGRVQRILVYSDADAFASPMQQFFALPIYRQNRDAFDRAIYWVTGETLPLALNRAPVRDDHFKWSIRTVGSIKPWLFLIVPGAFAILGFVILQRRRAA